MDEVSFTGHRLFFRALLSSVMKRAVQSQETAPFVFEGVKEEGYDVKQCSVAV